MNKLSTPDILSLWLAAACFGLIGVITMELMSPAEPGVDSQVAADPIVPEKLDVARYRPAPLDQFTQVLARPLFFEDRRLPPAPESPAPDEAPEEPLRLSLEGIAIVNAARVALLRDNRDNGLIQLSEGMSHNGWMLESVAPGTAAFRRGSDLEKLEVAASDENRRRRSRR